MSEPNWEIIFALPNIGNVPHIACEYFAIAPANDPILRKLLQQDNNVKSYSNRFRNEFGERIRPAFLIGKTSPNNSARNLEALSAFRDVLAFSYLTKQRAKILRNRAGLTPPFTDFFSFYPWILTKDNQWLTCNSPALLGVHEIRELKASSLAGLPIVDLSENAFDIVILHKLLELWNETFVRNKKNWENDSLFRSLNVAFRAGKTPGIPEFQLHDLGSLLVNWISAIEILCKKETKNVGILDVYEMLRKSNWTRKITKQRRYKLYNPRKLKSYLRGTYAEKLYGKMYMARNNFSHGNRIDKQSIFLNSTGRYIFEYAPLIYRMCLAARIGVIWNSEACYDSFEKSQEEYKLWQDIAFAQTEIEDALTLKRK